MSWRDDATPVDAGPAYPDWEDPPLPGGPVTPGGDRTVRSGVGLRTAALVGPGHRIPILYGRCLITPDITRAGMGGFYRGEYQVVISEGPIDAVESWLTDPDTIELLTVTLGTMLTPVAGLQGTIGLAAAFIRTKPGRPYRPGLIARGRKPYDPRLGAWGAGFYPDPTKCTYSTNPALCMADLKSFPQYGTGWPTVTPARVNWQSVADAAEWCDELISGAKRYELNLYVQLGKDAKLWEDSIGLHAGLRWREEGGLWHLDFSGPVATVSDPITTDHLVEDSTPRLVSAGGAGLADRPNVFTAEWIDPLAGWITRTVTVRHPAVEAGLEAERPARVYQLHGFQTETMAHRALWRIAHEVWSEQTLEADLTSVRLDLVEGSRVPVVLPSVGLSGEEFLVTKTTYDADIVRVTARRYDATTWSPEGGGENALDDESVFVTPGSLENVSWAFEPYTVDVVGVLGLVSQETRYRIAVEYDLPEGRWVRYVRLRLGTGTPASTTGGIVRVLPARVAVADFALPVADGDPVEMNWVAGGAGFAGTIVVEDGYVTGVVVTAQGSGYTDDLGSLQSAVNGQLLVALHITAKSTSWVEEFPSVSSWRFPALGNRVAPEGRGRIVIEDVPAPDIGNATPYGITVAAESVLGLTGPAAADGYSASYVSLPSPPSTGLGLLKEGDGSGLLPIPPIAEHAIPKGAGNGVLVNSKLADDGTTPTYDGHVLWHAGNDGTASGLDADTLDGQHAAAFAPTAHSHAQSDVTGLVTDLAAKAPLASPALTGAPTAPTPTAGDNSTKIATTAFVTAAVAAGGGGGKVLRAQEFLSGSTNWTAPTGVTEVWVTGCGGGGAGGNNPGGGSSSGGGGGGGESAYRRRLAVTPGNTYSVAIGNGGTTSSGNGNTGGTTSFGALLSLAGGGGGVAGSGSSSTGGNGGVAGGHGGTPGRRGEPSVASGQATGGMGGLSFPGGYGSGGHGTMQNDGNGARAGNRGYLVVEWNE